MAGLDGRAAPHLKMDGDLLFIDRHAERLPHNRLRVLFAAALYERRRSPVCGEYWLLREEEEPDWSDPDQVMALPHGCACYVRAYDLILVREEGENDEVLAHEQGHRIAGLCEACADIVGRALLAGRPTTVRCPSHACTRLGFP